MKHGADVGMADNQCQTPIHRASSTARHAVIRALLNSAPSQTTATQWANKRDKAGNSPLHLACEANDGELAMILINAGADKDVLNNDKQTPLQLASQNVARYITSQIE